MSSLSRLKKLLKINIDFHTLSTVIYESGPMLASQRQAFFKILYLNLKTLKKPSQECFRFEDSKISLSTNCGKHKALERYKMSTEN